MLEDVELGGCRVENTFALTPEWTELLGVGAPALSPEHGFSREGEGALGGYQGSKGSQKEGTAPAP